MEGLQFRVSGQASGAGADYVVILQGDLDYTSVPEIRDFVLGLDGDVEFDCAGVTFIDSAGVGMFAALADTFRVRRSKILLRGISEDCYRVFDTAGLTQMLDLGSANPTKRPRRRAQR
jgi:anti-sigma B factor antagonist